DTNEMHNIFGQKGTRKITSKMMQRLMDLIIKYDDKEAMQIFKTLIHKDPLPVFKPLP
ncbi:MAG: hypothetical protein H3C36_08355, partial [Chitinophagaceae bacterium]|nr:hypothetical protein [Chitinophagaceae bacterium]